MTKQCFIIRNEQTLHIWDLNSALRHQNPSFNFKAVPPTV